MKDEKKSCFDIKQGPFYLKDTLMWYDGPRLFTATDKDENLYLAHWVDEHELPDTEDSKCNGQDDFLVVPISEERLKLFLDNKLDMHDALRKADGGRGLYVKCVWRGGDTAEWVELKDLEEDLFCKPGVFYR